MRFVSIVKLSVIYLKGALAIQSSNGVVAFGPHRAVAYAKDQNYSS